VAKWQPLYGQFIKKFGNSIRGGYNLALIYSQVYLKNHPQPIGTSIAAAGADRRLW